MDQVLLSSSDITDDGKLKQSHILFSASTPSPETLLAQQTAVQDAQALEELRSQLQEMIGSR